MEEMEKRAEELADKMKSGAVASKEDEEVADPHRGCPRLPQV